MRASYILGRQYACPGTHRMALGACPLLLPAPSSPPWRRLPARAPARCGKLSLSSELHEPLTRDNDEMHRKTGRDAVRLGFALGPLLSSLDDNLSSVFEVVVASSNTNKDETGSCFLLLERCCWWYQ